MSYALYDFTESLDRAGFEPAEIQTVCAAWGYSPEGYGSWSGGFLMELTDGRFCYLSGWCDTTGWGCQDGVEFKFYEQRPGLDSLNKPTSSGEYEYEPPGGWDIDPADLNKWLADVTEH